MSFSCFNNNNFDYNALANKPRIGDTILAGDMRWEDLGIIPVVEAYTQAYAECCIIPDIDAKLCLKQDLLSQGCGICISEENEISVAPDSVLCSDSCNAVMNCTVSNMCTDLYNCIGCLCYDVYQCIGCDVSCLECAINTKQDKLEAGSSIMICGSCISVIVESTVSCCSENPAMSCAVFQAISNAMSCGYQAGNGLCRYVDACGDFVISLCDSVSICCDMGICNNLDVAGLTTLMGALTVCGPIYQCGCAYCTHAEEVYSTCDCIYLRDGNTSPLAAGCSSGFVVLYYNGTDCAVLSVDCEGTWRLGETDGDPSQPIATRSEACDLPDGVIAHWNSSCQCFEASCCCGSSLSWSTETPGSLACSKNCSCGRADGEAACADSIKVHCYNSFDALSHDVELMPDTFNRDDLVSGANDCISIGPVMECWTNCCGAIQCTGCEFFIGDICSNAKEIASFCIGVCCNCVAAVCNAGTGLEGTGLALTSCTGCCNSCKLLNSGSVSSIVENYNVLSCEDCGYMPVLCLYYDVHDNGEPIAPDTYQSSCGTSSKVCAEETCTYTTEVGPDTLGSFCDECCYYTYDSGTCTYAPAHIDSGTYSPETYCINMSPVVYVSRCFTTSTLAYRSVGSSYNIGACIECLRTDCCGTLCVGSMELNWKASTEFGTNIYCYAASNVQYDPDCRECITVCENACMYINSVTRVLSFKSEMLCICTCQNGNNYFVQSYGTPGDNLVQRRCADGIEEMRQCCYCECCGCWTSWSPISSGAIYVAECGASGMCVSLPHDWLKSQYLQAAKVMFPYGYCTNCSSCCLTLNGIPVVSNQEGSYKPLIGHELSSSCYSMLSQGAILDLYYLKSYGTDGAWVVIGNPAVLSTGNGNIYADGSLDGGPVGTVIGLYKKSDPYGYVYLNGCCWNGVTCPNLTSKYPKLYCYLGTKCVPDYREFALVGAECNTTSPVISYHEVYTQGKECRDQIQRITGCISNSTNAVLANDLYGGHCAGSLYVAYGSNGRTLTRGDSSTQGMILCFDSNLTARSGCTTHGLRKAVYFYMKAM